MIGGYAIVNCEGINLGDPGEVTGIYEKFVTALASDKLLILENLRNGTQFFTPVPAFGGRESATSVFCSFFPVTLHISSSDVVSI